MILRIIIILGCVLFFINGCSSLVSSLVGTHKLRSMSMQDIQQTGLGDADYVAINGTWSSGDYIFQAHRNASWPGFVQWPVLDALQIDSLEEGHPVTVSVYAWTKRYKDDCIEAQNCIQKGPVELKGLVRPLNKRFNRMADFSSEKYKMAEHPIFIEYNRRPLAWYWNLAIMIGSAAFVLLLERWRVRKERAAQKI